MIDSNCTPDQLRRLPTPVGILHPVRPAALLDALLADANRRGWGTPDVRIQTDRNQSAVVLLLSAKQGPGRAQPPFRYWLLASCRNDGHHKNIYYGGVEDLRGGAALLCADVYGKRHAPKYDPLFEVRAALDGYTVQAGLFADKLAHLRGRKVSTPQARDALCRAAEQGHIPWSRVGVALKMFAPGQGKYGALRETPGHPYASQWNLLRAFALASARGPGWRWPARLWTFYQFFKEGILAGDFGNR